MRDPSTNTRTHFSRHCAGGRSAAIGIGRNLSNSRRDIGKRRETSLVSSNDRVGSSEPELLAAGKEAGCAEGHQKRKGDPDRQKVLTYRQLDARVRSNMSVRNLRRRTHKRTFLFRLYCVS